MSVYLEKNTNFDIIFSYKFINKRYFLIKGGLS